jgi:rSAM/selenodomain-associated transferase 2
MPALSVVIPVLDDTDEAAAVIAQIPDDPALEVVVSDGGTDRALEALAATRAHTRLVRSPPGRGRQMNMGAAATSGEWLLFLHADSRLPAGWREAFATLDDEVCGGWFRFALDDAAWQARLIERAVAWRVRRLRLPYGDQGLFVRRRVFEALGGFRDLPLLEDVDLVRRLVRIGPTCELPLSLRTSSRRWRRDGWLRRSARNVAIVTLYFAGVSESRLATWYRGRT